MLESKYSEYRHIDTLRTKPEKSDLGAAYK
jgi:hypothetical protein